MSQITITTEETDIKTGLTRGAVSKTLTLTGHTRAFTLRIYSSADNEGFVLRTTIAVPANEDQHIPIEDYMAYVRITGQTAVGTAIVDASLDVAGT